MIASCLRFGSLRERRCRVWSWCIALAVFSPALAASAQTVRHRVALVNPGAQLEHAVRTALEPWRIEIVVVPGPSPGATAPPSNQLARNLALAHDASAVAWVSKHRQGHALWVYDRATDHAVVRPLSFRPPFDGPTAAAVALSIKTLLRHSAAVPEGERYGAAGVDQTNLADGDAALARATQSVDPKLAAVASSSARQAPSVTPQAEVGTQSQSESGEPEHQIQRFVLDTPAQTNAAPRAALPVDTQIELAGAASTGAQRAAPEVGTALSSLELEAAAGLRAALTRRSDAEARFGAGLAYWPRSGAIGLTLQAAGVPGARLSTARLRARLTQLSASVAGRLRWDPLRELRLSVGAGPAVHITVLDGFLPEDAQHVNVVRVVPGLSVGVEADWLAASWLRLGVWAGVSWLFETQRYRVRGRAVFDLAELSFESGAVLGCVLLD